jgi:hypothetical protein
MGDLPAMSAPQGAQAFLVGWLDKHTSVFVDAGIYSERAPTSPDMTRIEPIVLAHAESRFNPADGGYERACDRLRAHVLGTTALAWVLRARTFLLQEDARRGLEASRGAL